MIIDRKYGELGDLHSPFKFPDLQRLASESKFFAVPIDNLAMDTIVTAAVVLLIVAVREFRCTVLSIFDSEDHSAWFKDHPESGVSDDTIQNEIIASLEIISKLLFECFVE